MDLFKAVLFDFDGTIVDSKEGITKSIMYALEKYDIPVEDESKLEYFIGPPLYVSFYDMFGVEGELSDKLVEAYRERYAVKGIYENKIYDGILDILKELRANGVKVGIASAKPTVYVKKIIEYLEIDDLFDTVVGNELHTVISDKSHLVTKALENLNITENEKCAMVGDRHYDISGALKAGVKAVGAVYGFGSEDELNDAGADFLAHDATELLNILLNKS